MVTERLGLETAAAARQPTVAERLGLKKGKAAVAACQRMVTERLGLETAAAAR